LFFILLSNEYIVEGMGKLERSGHHQHGELGFHPLHKKDALNADFLS